MALEKYLILSCRIIKMREDLLIIGVAGSVAGRFLFKSLAVVRLVMRGPRRCLGLVEDVQMSRTGIRHHGLIA